MYKFNAPACNKPAPPFHLVAGRDRDRSNVVIPEGFKVKRVAAGTAHGAYRGARGGVAGPSASHMGVTPRAFWK